MTDSKKKKKIVKDWIFECENEIPMTKKSSSGLILEASIKKHVHIHISADAGIGNMNK